MLESEIDRLSGDLLPVEHQSIKRRAIVACSAFRSVCHMTVGGNRKTVNTHAGGIVWVIFPFLAINHDDIVFQLRLPMNA